MTHSLKLCRSLRRMSPMYSQPRERRKVRKSRPNQIQSHCKGAGEKLTADPHFQLRVPNGWQLSGASCQALGCSALLYRQREIFFLGRESPFPPAAYEHTWPPYPLQAASALDFQCPPHPYSTLLVCILSLGHFLQWQLYRQWRQRAQTEQQPGDSAMVRAWEKGHSAIRDSGRRWIPSSLPGHLRSSEVQQRPGPLLSNRGRGAGQSARLDKDVSNGG